MSRLYQKSPIREMKAGKRHFISEVVNFTVDFKKKRITHLSKKKGSPVWQKKKGKIKDFLK